MIVDNSAWTSEPGALRSLMVELHGQPRARDLITWTGVPRPLRLPLRLRASETLDFARSDGLCNDIGNKNSSQEGNRYWYASRSFAITKPERVERLDTAKHNGMPNE